MAAATPETVRRGTILTKGRRRYRYVREATLGSAPGFLLEEITRTHLEGTAPHWAPDWALGDFEVEGT